MYNMEYHIPMKPEHKAFLKNCYHDHPKCWAYHNPGESSCPIAAACLEPQRAEGESELDFCIRWENGIAEALEKYFSAR